MKEFFSASELVGLPGLPGTQRGILFRAEREKWQSRRKRVGKGQEYALTSLPAATQAAILVQASPATAPVPAVRPKRMSSRKPSDAQLAAAWDRFNAATDRARAEAHLAAQRLDAVAVLVAHGTSRCEAREQVAAAMQVANEKGGSARTLARWESLVDQAARSDWPALLLPDYTGRTAVAECDPRCWDWYKGHYLQRSRPSHASTYARLREIAAAQGWTIPSAKTLVRRIESEISELTRVLLRDGLEAVTRRLPTRERDATVFAAGQAVNGDGLKFDRLWVAFDDGEIINTATAWFWQDVRTRKILAWRLDKTENTDVFRLATYDLTAVCAPEFVYIDNTRVAANKLMTAGATNRHRFKAEPEDGIGLLQMLGMEPLFTNPDHEIGNPGAKPIERAFGVGGIHSEVATHPRIAALGGFSRATAIPVNVLREVIAEEVARHNAREKRRTAVCRNVLSFDQAWAESLAQRPPRVLAETQRRLLLMAREVVTIKKTGLIELEAGRSRHGRNSYWNEAATNFIRERVAVHFDPANLAAGVHVYSLDGRYMFSAEHRPAAAFNDTEAARNDSRWKKASIKAAKRAADLEQRRDAQEREKLYGQSKPDPAPSPANPTTVVEGVFSRTIDPARDAARQAHGPGDVVPMRRTGTDPTPVSDEVRTIDLNRHLEALQKRQFEQRGWLPPTD